MIRTIFLLTKTLYTLNAKISPYLFPMFLNLYFLKFKITKIKPIIVSVVYRPNSAPRADVDMFISKI